MQQKNTFNINSFETRKTVQKFSLRNEIKMDPELFRDKNNKLYLNKKAQDLRLKQKINKLEDYNKITLQNKQNENQNKIDINMRKDVWKNISTLCLDLTDNEYNNKLVQLLSDLGTVSESQLVKENIKYKNFGQEISEKERENIEQQENQKVSKEERLKMFLLQNLTKEDVKTFFKEYSREKLKDKLNIFKNNSMNFNFTSSYAKIEEQKEQDEEDEGFEKTQNLLQKQQMQNQNGQVIKQILNKEQSYENIKNPENNISILKPSTFRNKKSSISLQLQDDMIIKNQKNIEIQENLDSDNISSQIIGIKDLKNEQQEERKDYDNNKVQDKQQQKVQKLMQKYQKNQFKSDLFKDSVEDNPLQEKYILTQITEPKNYNITKVLKLNDNNKKIKFKKSDPDMDKFAEDRKQGKLTSKEIMNKLIQDQEKLTQQRVINMYKESKLEDVDPSGNKNNKYSMMSFKKKTELQQKMQDKFSNQESSYYLNGIKNPEIDAEKFVRPRQKAYGINKQEPVFVRLTSKNFSRINSGIQSTQHSVNNLPSYYQSTQQTTRQDSVLISPRTQSYAKSPQNSNFIIRRPQTAQNSECSPKSLFSQQSTAYPLNVEQKLIKNIERLKKLGKHKHAKRDEELLATLQQKNKFQDLMNLCEQDLEQQKEREEIKNNLNTLEKKLEQELENIEDRNQNLEKEASIKDPIFNKFKQEQKFKRSLVQFLSQQVENKSEAVSQYADKIRAEQFAKNLMGGLQKQF
ncbi:hypothetical protein PPERSA_07164 [Pseudocohnilembus persalinus]|uniref:Uncharacterized protein n=1 Tax=Pseudocohnilembus persalinus TaxID=266149 RepID=A0A0V0QX72_PSEPJ|nr:hypothetical protein PPERSA_07164 [Pseudocohnilembus persalinus]|eukprot:KRX07001.1 hypothetical protein PPERSA_07164 [Pseudocohnilembus persalinus]